MSFIMNNCHLASHLTNTHLQSQLYITIEYIDYKTHVRADALDRKYKHWLFPFCIHSLLCIHNFSCTPIASVYTIQYVHDNLTASSILQLSTTMQSQLYQEHECHRYLASMKTRIPVILRIENLSLSLNLMKSDLSVVQPMNSEYWQQPQGKPITRLQRSILLRFWELQVPESGLSCIVEECQKCSNREYKPK